MTRSVWLAAAQHTTMVAFGRSQVDEQAGLVAAGRLGPEKLGHGVAARRAPLLHDHIRAFRAGGPTSGKGSTPIGGVGCARGNYVREMPGWQVKVVHDGLGDQPHTVRTTTPTGHTYTSRAGP